jgi:hypothetical protein
VAGATGKAIGDQTVTIATDELGPGSYQYALRVLKCGKPGTAEERFSRAFSVPLGGAAPPTGSDAPNLPELPLAPWPLPTLLPTVPARA